MFPTDWLKTRHWFLFRFQRDWVSTGVLTNGSKYSTSWMSRFPTMLKWDASLTPPRWLNSVKYLSFTWTCMEMEFRHLLLFNISKITRYKFYRYLYISRLSENALITEVSGRINVIYIARIHSFFLRYRIIYLQVGNRYLGSSLYTTISYINLIDVSLWPTIYLSSVQINMASK